VVSANTIRRLIGKGASPIFPLASLKARLATTHPPELNSTAQSGSSGLTRHRMTGRIGSRDSA
jgi:hypothetical protein